MPEPTEQEKLATVQQELAAQQQAKEVEIKLESGEVFKGRDYEEVSQKLATAKLEATKHIRSLEGQVRDLSARPEPPKEEVQAGKFDKATYWKKWEDNPLEAEDYLDQYRKPSELTELKQQVEHIVGMFEGSQFLAMNPDFPASPENSQKVLKAATDQGLQMNARNLTMIYNDMKIRGEIQPVEDKPSARPGPAAPSLGQSGGSMDSATGDLIQQANNMPLDELEKLLIKAGVKPY